MSETRKGIITGFLCYLFWGVCPIYWKLLVNVDSLEIIAQRILWCAAMTVGICFVMRLDLPGLLKDKRAWKILLPAAILITFNWGIYIYAVNIGCVVQTAIGYYINPLVSIVLGIVFFSERLTKLQVIAVALCAFGVVFFTVSYGEFPWISLALAFSFGLYGAVKKKGGYPAAQALAMENVILFFPVLIFAIVLAFVTGQHAFLGDVSSVDGWVTTLLLIGGGPVTAIPLLLFSTAANKIPLSLLGFIQYVSPTIALLLGVFLFGEAFTFAHAVLLVCIWSGLALVSVQTLRGERAGVQ